MKQHRIISYVEDNGLGELDDNQFNYEGIGALNNATIEELQSYRESFVESSFAQGRRSIAPVERSTIKKGGAGQIQPKEQDIVLKP